MKKLYKQPQTAKAELMPITIVCTSGGYGGSSDTLGNGQEIELP